MGIFASWSLEDGALDPGDLCGKSVAIYTYTGQASMKGKFHIYGKPVYQCLVNCDLSCSFER